MASIMNDIEADRVGRLGGSRERGDGNFYTAAQGTPPGSMAAKVKRPKTAAEAAKAVMRDPKAFLSAKTAAASALTQKVKR